MNKWVNYDPCSLLIQNNLSGWKKKKKKKDIIGHQTMIIFKDGAHNDALSSMTSSQGAKKIIFEASIY